MEATVTPMMSVQVLAGPGIVARFGDILLWMEEGESGGKAVIAQLLDLTRRLAKGGDGREAGVQVAEVLRIDPRAVPALVLVAVTPGGLQAVVHGWGRVLADGVDIDGGWVDREMAWTTGLAAGRGGDHLRAPTPGSVLDLGRGSTPGGGAAVILAAQATLPSTSPATAPDQAELTPIGGPGGAVPQHDGPRPSLGRLVLDDGTALELDRDHVVGSAPEADVSVAQGARPVCLDDPSGQLAPVHAEVRLFGWDVMLIARAPTFVVAAGGQHWAPAPPGQPSPLPAGTRVALGQRTFVVELTAASSGP